jgi:NADH pyrophosphatase NudC (nudix superfamily)
MIGFLAQADDTLPLHIDPNELVSASWFDKDQVQAAALVPGAVMNAQVAEQALTTNPSLQVLIPPKGVLARALIDQWLQMDGL